MSTPPNTRSGAATGENTRSGINTQWHALTTSPQSSDPLSWSLRFNLPLLVALWTAITGTVAALVAGAQGASTLGVLFATALVVLGCLIVVFDARPHRPLVRPAQTIAPFTLGLLCVFVSGAAHRGSDVPLIEWTGPLGLCAVMLVLVPFSPAALTALYGVVGAAASSTVALWAYGDHPVGPVGVIMAGATYPLHVGIVGAVFSGMLVIATARWRLLPYERWTDAETEPKFIEHLERHGTPLTIDDRVLALLERVGETGRVGVRERADAAELAGSIRSDLARVAERTWLDELIAEGLVVVGDPDSALKRMSRDQRATLQGIVSAALESPLLGGAGRSRDGHDTEAAASIGGPGHAPLNLELRPMADGTTAVALRMDISLPEGRRVMMFAPQFVSLKTTVDDLHWDVDEQLRMRFKLPPADRQ